VSIELTRVAKNVEIKTHSDLNSIETLGALVFSLIQVIDVMRSTAIKDAGR
jgi:hypothetical protein